MAKLSLEERERIVKVLEAKGATKPCPRCGNSTFSLVDGYFNHAIQTELGTFTLGGSGIPTAVLTCVNCGWLAEHALGKLDLLPSKEVSP